MDDNSKQAEEVTEYILALTHTGLSDLGRQDVNRAEYNEGATELREKPISDSLKGVIPNITDPEDNYTGTAGLVGDLLDSGHGYVVDTRPEGRKEPRTHCQNCGEQFLFQIKPCLSYNPQWMPKGEKRMIGTPETDGSPLPWWSADRLGCQCLNCKSLSRYMENSRVPATRKFCTDTCRKAAHKAGGKAPEHEGVSMMESMAGLGLSTSFWKRVHEAADLCGMSVEQVIAVGTVVKKPRLRSSIEGSGHPSA